MRDVSKDYSNGEVTIHWKAELCKHSAKCYYGLPQVFNPGKRPWVNVKGASTERIVAQVSKCPSGALTASMNSDLQQP